MASLYEQMTGTPNYDDILNSNLSREQKAQAIRERGAAYDKSVDKNKWKNIGRASAGSLVSGVSFLPAFNIPYVGTGIGGALYDLGQGIAEGDKLPELAKRTGRGFVIGETVGAVPYVGKAASKTKVGQAVGNSAPVKAVGEGISKAGEKFANSKLYDALMTDVTGNWIKGYHGTPYKFKIFDFNKVGSNTDTGMWGDGLYFTKYPEIAEHYANYKGKNGYIKKVNLDFKNPLVIDNKQQVDEINKIIEPQIPSETMEDLINGSKLYSQAFKDYVFKNGYDSVIDNYSGLGRNGEQLVAFLPEQIKSNNLFDYLSNDSVLTKGYRENKKLIDNEAKSLYEQLSQPVEMKKRPGYIYVGSAKKQVDNNGNNLYNQIMDNNTVKLNWNNAEKSNWKGTNANGKYGKSKSRYYNNQKYRDWDFDIRVSDHNKALKGSGQWSDDSYREIDFDGIKVKINEDFFNGDNLDIVVNSITDFNKIKSKLNKYLQKQIPIIYENELHSVMPNIYK